VQTPRQPIALPVVVESVHQHSNAFSSRILESYMLGSFFDSITPKAARSGHGTEASLCRLQTDIINVNGESVTSISNTTDAPEGFQAAAGVLNG